MGGQACVLYGAAEFSRDLDLACVIVEQDLPRWWAALDELQAEVIAVPPFSLLYLEHGHAVHFRCRHPELMGLRIDIMSRMRGVAPFKELWLRRTTLEIEADLVVEVLALRDLVQAKKTQRDKDWPMIRRLLEADYLRGKEGATPAQKEFWLRELRTPEFLIELAADEEELANKISAERFDVIFGAQSASRSATRKALAEEEARERDQDRSYWQELRRELEALRHAKIKGR